MHPLRLAPLLASLALAACDPVHHLDDMSSDELRVEVAVWQSVDIPDDFGVHVRIKHVEPDQCIVLDDTFTGSLNGQVADLVERGLDRDDCWDPQLTFPVSRDRRVPSATLTLGDSTRTITVDLADRLMPRTSTLVAPADAVLRPGAPLELTWSSAIDREVGDFVLFLEHDGQGGVAELRPTVQGDRVIVDAPATLPASGEGKARLVLADDWTAGGIALPCNDATCSLRAWYEVDIPVRYGR